MLTYAVARANASLPVPDTFEVLCSVEGVLLKRRL